jgi:methyltransferase
MPEFPSPISVVVLLVALQRLGELAYAGRNTRRLRRQGAQEHGAGHYPFLVTLHAAWLVGLLFVVPGDRWPDPWIFALFLVLQPLRIWIILSLGPYWTTRILVLPNHMIVRRGPYRYLKHPNYLLVILEIAALPLAFGALGLAVVFSIANLAILARRVTVESRALARDGRSSLCDPAHRQDARR